MTTPSIIGLNSPIIWYQTVEPKQENNQDDGQGNTGEIDSGSDSSINNRNGDEVDQKTEPKRNKRNETNKTE
ncbi:TPA: hypothetical protein QB072_000524 [Pasteurella multocida]|nr:hypothetical protein [Pasteurella multocida]APB79321.1 hypothetical protein BMF22_04455 [Pasteurella multocida]ATC21820.1 hypothetical protein CLD34_00750 [Pasteurella multocida]KEP94346.1 hypothetical protein UQU_0200070 [Pasteurella multocida subsp. multocida VTCCBAA264]KEZ10034.1 hypothetical protein GJ36_04185 [Pasteurella multocida]KEZ10559.1 hypothetical protein GJ37_04410 [Pasteurella multocida]